MVTFWYSMVRYRRTHEAGNLEPSFKRCRFVVYYFLNINRIDIHIHIYIYINAYYY